MHYRQVEGIAADRVRPVKWCLLFWPYSCVTPTFEFPVWEIVSTAFVTALTIAVTVWVSTSISRREIRAERARERTDRRKRMVATFAELCEALLQALLKKESVETVELFTSVLAARVGADARDEDAEVVDWMRRASSEIIRSVEPGDNGVNLSAAASVMMARLYNLRLWPESATSWEQYRLDAKVPSLEEMDRDTDG
jgi:hypothetical protein